MRRAAMALMAALTLAGPATAVTPDEQLPDPALEARAVKISRELRCVVCQNQTIDDSDAGLARDLRILLRERLVAGDTDEQAIQFIVERYGAYVLLRPRFEAQTLVLWLGPFLVLLGGGAAVAIYLRRRQQVAATTSAPLSAAEEKQLKTLLEPEDGA